MPQHTLENEERLKEKLENNSSVINKISQTDFGNKKSINIYGRWIIFIDGMVCLKTALKFRFFLGALEYE